MEDNYLDSVKIRALASVMDPDYDDFVQAVFEWYSREYYTPLHMVADLPVDEVLHVYYRHIYRQMDPEERHNEAIWLLETPEERKARKEANKKAEDEFLAMSQAKAKTFKRAVSRVDRALKAMKEKAQLAAEGDGLNARVENSGPQKVNPIPESQLGGGDQPQQDEVTVTYMSEEEFERELEKPIGPTPPKRNL